MKLYLVVKRLFDIVASLLAIVVLVVPWLVIAIVIRIVSPGPVIFQAKRVGLNGKPFTLYKFRTMRVDSGNIAKTTLAGDSRVFPFGGFLRKSKLDETPQLINILLGQMSVIGPRPEDEVNAAEFYVGEYERVLTVRPGLSSPASLFDYTHGEQYACEEDYMREFFPKKMALELYYIDNRSWLYDLKIIFKTVATILLVMIGKDDFSEPEEMLKCGNV